MSKNVLENLISKGEFLKDETICGYTYNYEVFKFISSNREINRTSIEQLKRSIRKEGYCPSSYVLVDEDFNILDGQHRFVACKELGMPIYVMCIENLNVEHMRILNTISKNWKTTDFIEHYAKLGSEDYKILNNLIDRCDCSVSVILNLLFGHRGESLISCLQLGTLSISEEELDRFNKRYNMYKLLMLEYKNNFKINTGDDVRKMLDIFDNDFMCYSLIEKIKQCPNKIIDLTTPKSEINYYEYIAKQIMN